MKNKTRKFNGSRLHDFRINAGWSMEVMAELMGCDASSISLWEAGSQMPSPKNLKKIADLFKVQPTDLLQ